MANTIIDEDIVKGNEESEKIMLRRSDDCVLYAADVMDLVEAQCGEITDMVEYNNSFQYYYDICVNSLPSGAHP